MQVEAVLGDITQQHVDAVVNAANSGLLGGGGVDGAIHRAAGPELLQACRELRRERFPQGLPVGQAVATPGFALPARWVLHTVGPNRHQGQTDPGLLRRAFLSCLRLAADLGCRSVALPAVSGGAYGWAADDVAREAAGAVRDFAYGLEGAPGPVGLVRFVLFNEPLLTAFRTHLDGMGGSGACFRETE
ncbi:O-acetyl-ADP-ribose deacetylase [Actinomyces weissii]|uniref:O-acetyl-ADP-ribose deacetylase n=1 Tax=Actinomyces weissii TaxID=675090 RepID=A0A7T7M804_9ACTO|nr:O-acetyl-ADP-ribose deacetylase [Actinomyces weissii]QQM66560.1 O-acetyl-ADP-ribose deacetylase [Actinomyces weissii]